jgi:hypothetical protein
VGEFDSPWSTKVDRSSANGGQGVSPDGYYRAKRATSASEPQKMRWTSILRLTNPSGHRAAIPRLILAIAVITTLGGCGDEERASQTREASRPRSDATVRHLSAWRDDATAYITTLENCLRRANPIPGSWNSCTRSARLGYGESVEQVLKSKLSRNAPSRACRSAFIRAKSLVDEVTHALDAAWRAIGRSIRAANNGTTSQGAAPVSRLDRARRITEDGTKLVARLSSTLQPCTIVA